jgi:predicted alpha/beta-hydrolase family hydrolase
MPDVREVPVQPLTLAVDAVTPPVSALYQPVASARALLVLAHGAGANMAHSHMAALAAAFASVGIATLRFNFPFMQGPTRRPPNSRAVCLATLAAAMVEARQLAPQLPLLLGGHSFGGRMASHFVHAQQEQGLPCCQGLVYCSFPLHPAAQPATKRAAHLPALVVPQLFLSGSRDGLARTDLLTAVVAQLPLARLHLLAGADHSFQRLKRGPQAPDAYLDAAAATAAWLQAAPMGGSAGAPVATS